MYSAPIYNTAPASIINFGSQFHSHEVAGVRKEKESLTACITALRSQIKKANKGARGLTVGPYRSTYSRILQFHRYKASDNGEVVTPFMQDGTYPTRKVWRLTGRLIPGQQPLP